MADLVSPVATPADRGSSSRRTLLALLGGGLIAATFLDFALWPLAWVAFAPILLAIAQPVSRRQAVWLGLAAGLATNVPAFHWLLRTIHVFGGFPFIVAAGFYFALSVYSSLELVLFALAIRRLGSGPLAAYPALVWVSLEFFFPNLFPWRLANSQLEVPVLLQIGDLTGPYGLSFVMVWASAALAAAISRRGDAGRALASAAAAVVVVVAYGVLRLGAIDRATASAPRVRVGIVQGNLGIEEKQNVRYLEGNLATYRDLTLGLTPEPDVVIWPESVISEPLPRTLRALSPAGREMLGLRRPLLTGAMTFDANAAAERFYNSIMLFDAEGRVLGISDKQVLMPFGEYMPLGSLLPWLRRMSPQTGDFQAGSAIVPLDVPGVARFAPLNCYEDLRARLARAAVADDGAEILFAVANDGWFGESMAPFQHEALALWRAVENRRFLIRATNTGVTDVIDPAGRVVLRLPVFRPVATVAEVRRLGFSSPYTRFGDWFAWLITALAMSALATSPGSQDRSAHPSLPRPPS